VLWSCCKKYSIKVLLFNVIIIQVLRNFVKKYFRRGKKMPSQRRANRYLIWMKERPPRSTIVASAHR
jgi:hypothetical protein